MPLDRNKRPRVAGSPDSRGGGSTSGRRDGKDKDRPRSRESGGSDRAGSGGSIGELSVQYHLGIVNRTYRASCDEDHISDSNAVYGGRFEDDESAAAFVKESSFWFRHCIQR